MQSMSASVLGSSHFNVSSSEDKPFTAWQLPYRSVSMVPPVSIDLKISMMYVQGGQVIYRKRHINQSGGA